MSSALTLSKGQAYILSVCVAYSYVIAVLIAQFFVPSTPPLWRDRFEVVRARMIAVSISSLWMSFLVCQMSTKYNSYNMSSFELALRLLGLPYGISSLTSPAIRAYVIVPVLFLGPLFSQFLSKELPFQRNWSLSEHVESTYLSYKGIRNYVLAPITEEVTFRACVLAVFKLGGVSRSKMIWLSPCLFGIAHLYHMRETYARGGSNKRALQQAALVAAFQFCYTTVFGWICSFLFMRTGSLLVVIVNHAFCNMMGFPQLQRELQEHPSHKIAILLAYLLGVGLFAYVLYPWSNNPDSFYWET